MIAAGGQSLGEDKRSLTQESKTWPGMSSQLVRLPEQPRASRSVEGEYSSLIFSFCFYLPSF